MQSGRNPPAILDALGDPVRRVIFQRLARAASNVTSLAKGLPVTRSAVSRHLKVLKDAGLVEAVADGRSQVYSLSRGGLGPLAAWIRGIEASSASDGLRAP
jgi:DNA-binding transcriptional ArsR family regulator